MPNWKPKDTNKNRKIADEVARYYYAYFNFMGRKPKYRAIATHFERSETWVGHYLGRARDLGFIRDEWIVRIENRERLSIDSEI